MMDLEQSVRIKFVSDDKIEARVTGATVPRTDEKIRILNHDHEKNLDRGEWFVVEDVWWHVYNTAERKPDVVEVWLTDPDPDEESDST